MKNSMRFLVLVFVAFIAIRCFQGNPVGTPISPANSTQAASVYAALAMYGDNIGVAMLDSKDKSMVAVLGDFLTHSIESRAEAATCPNPLFGSSACGGGSTVTVALGGCVPSLNPGVTWTGSALFSFDSNASCAASVPAGIASLPINGSVTLTAAGGLTRTATDGSYVKMDSQPSGYLTTASGGETMTAGNGSAPCVSGRCITINGFHRAAYSSTGTLLFDHTITSNSPLNLLGTGSSLVVNSGAVYMQDNVNKILMNVVVSGPLFFNGTCCFPVQGQIETLYSGTSRTYTELTQFGPACGQASVNSNPIILTNCL